MINIIKQVIDKGKVVGYVVKTANLEYAVCTAGLMAENVFLELVNTGYLYYGDGVFCLPDGESLDTLPTINFMDLSEDDQIDFEIFSTNKIAPHVERTYISKKAPKNAPKLAEPIEYLINTRQELIDYANYSLDSYPLDDIRRFMPVNSFTNPHALLTEKEYSMKSNGTLISQLMHKQTLTIQNYHQFLKYITETLNMPINSPHDVLCAYYSWGLPGLSSELHNRASIERSNELTVRGSKPRVLFEKIPVFINRTNHVIPSDIEFSDIVWAPYYDNPTHGIRDLLDPSQYMAGVQKKSAPQLSLVLTYANLKAEILPGTIKVSTSTMEKLYSGLCVRYTSQTLVPTEFWDYNNEETAKKYHHFLISVAAAMNILEQTRDKYNANTYRVLRTSGMSHTCAIEHLLTRFYHSWFKDPNWFMQNYGIDVESVGTKQPENVDDPDEYRNLIAFHNNPLFDGWDEMFRRPKEDDEELNYFDDYINRIISGDVCFDHIAAVKNTGSSIRVTLNSLQNFFYACLEVMGVSEAEVLNAFDTIQFNQKGAGMIQLAAPGGEPITLCHKVQKMSNVKGAYFWDLYYTKWKIAKNASYWVFVTDVYTEHYVENRAVAVKGKTWPRGNIWRNRNHKMTEDYIYQALDNVYSYVDREEDENRKEADIAAVLDCILTGRYTKSGDNIICTINMAPKMKTPVNVYLNSSIVNTVNNLALDIVETTVTLCDQVTSNIAYNIYVVNAYITPYTVIPKANDVSFPCTDIYFAYSAGVGRNEQYYRQHKASGRYNPTKEEFSLYDCVANNFNLRYMKFPNDADALSVRDYCTEVLAAAKTKAYVEHPYDRKYPVVYSDIPMDKTWEGHQFKLITKKDAFTDKYQEFVIILNLDNEITLDKKVTPFMAYGIEELSCYDYGTQTYELIENISEPFDGIRAVNVTDRGVTFTDGTTTNIEMLDSLMGNGYAIKRVTGNVYLVKNRNGKIFRVVL